MANLAIKEPTNKARMNASDQGEMRWWSKKFNVSAGILVKAVEGAGPDVEDVKSWLRAESARIKQAKAEKEAAHQRAIDLAKSQKAKEETEKLNKQRQADAKRQVKPEGVAWESMAGDKTGSGAAEGQSRLQPNSIKEPEDKSEVNVDDPLELTWWAKQFEISIDRLQEVIITIGNDPEKIKTYLYKREEWENETGYVRKEREEYQGAGARQLEDEEEGDSLFSRLRKSFKKLLIAITGKGDSKIPDEDKAIFVNDPANLAMWAERFETDIVTLRSVVLAVGNKPGKVQRYLALRQAWENAFGSRDKDGKRKPRRNILPAPVRKKLLQWRRSRQALYDRYLPKIPWGRIPFIKNKIVMRGLAMVTTAIVIKLVTGGGADAEKLNDPSKLLQQTGIVSQDDLGQATEFLEQQDAANADPKAKKLPPEAQKIIDAVNKSLKNSEEQQNRRLESLDNLKK